MMANPALKANTPMPAEIDFSNATRGKFHRPGMRISLPVYLEADVQAHLAQRAHARGVDMAQLVNELLKKEPRSRPR
jgi:hypothetical protein